MTEEHFRKLERLYVGARTNEYYQPGITVGQGVAEIRVPVKEDFYHAAHAVHGSVYFKVADDAAFFAANSLVEGVFVLTASFSIELLRPVREGVLVARGEVLHGSGKSYLAQARVYGVDPEAPALAQDGVPPGDTDSAPPRIAGASEERLSFDEAEAELVAFGTGRFVRSRIRLDESVGYA